MSETTTTQWVLPDGSIVYETTEDCPDCHHHHSPQWGGICIGCPCENVRKDEARAPGGRP